LTQTPGKPGVCFFEQIYVALLYNLNMQNQNKNRKSIRIKEYDYSSSSDYFITICTQNRECIFGEVVDGKMVLNNVGEMIKQTIEEIPIFYLNIEVDIFSIMPNHLHMIICIVGADPRVRPIENELR